jgi:hypothetical protein
MLDTGLEDKVVLITGANQGARQLRGRVASGNCSHAGSLDAQLG